MGFFAYLLKFQEFMVKGVLFFYFFIFWYQSKGPKVTTEERDPPNAYERRVDNDKILGGSE